MVRGRVGGSCCKQVPLTPVRGRPNPARRDAEETGAALGVKSAGPLEHVKGTTDTTGFVTGEADRAAGQKRPD